jgi:hypothetical protein
MVRSVLFEQLRYFIHSPHNTTFGVVSDEDIRKALWQLEIGDGVSTLELINHTPLCSFFPVLL